MNGSAYAFRVAATNAVGSGPESAPSEPVTPAATTGITLACSPASLVLATASSTTITCWIGSVGLAGRVSIGARDAPGYSVWPFVDEVELSEGGVTAFAVAVDAEPDAPSSGSTSLLVEAHAGTASAAASLSVVGVENLARVHAVYVVPSDAEVRPETVRGIERGMRHLQIWFARQMGGTTFTMAYPVVKVVTTPHDASWFGTNPIVSDPSLWFFYNAAEVAGAHAFDDANIWNVYIDAAPPPGQPTGGVPSITVLPLNDVLGIAGLNTAEPNVCRWVGGLGHELGHAAGLPHSDGDSIMWMGYGSYPAASLTNGERTALAGTTWFAGTSVTDVFFECGDLWSF